MKLLSKIKYFFLKLKTKNMKDENKPILSNNYLNIDCTYFNDPVQLLHIDAINHKKFDSFKNGPLSYINDTSSIPNLCYININTYSDFLPNGDPIPNNRLNVLKDLIDHLIDVTPDFENDLLNLGYVIFTIRFDNSYENDINEILHYKVFNDPLKYSTSSEGDSSFTFKISYKDIASIFDKLDNQYLFLFENDLVINSLVEIMKYIPTSIIKSSEKYNDVFDISNIYPIDAYSLGCMRYKIAEKKISKNMNIFAYDVSEYPSLYISFNSELFDGYENHFLIKQISEVYSQYTENIISIDIIKFLSNYNNNDSIHKNIYDYIVSIAESDIPQIMSYLNIHNYSGYDQVDEIL